MSFEHDVFVAHSAGKLDQTLIEMFLPKGQIRNIEGPMWDYKVGFCNPKATVHEEALLCCELLNDIAALYNAFGGYLVVGFKDEQAAHFRRFLNKDDFDKLADRYLRTYLPIAPFHTKSQIGGDVANVLIIHVAKRAVGPPIAYKRNSALREDKSSVFKTDDIPLRYGSSTLIINQRHDLLIFAFGDRKADVGELPGPLNEIDNNLPARDPNLIEFIGRREYLVQLWNWLADVRNPVKVLTALGGTGKTAIAYEFCEQLVKSRSEAFAKVIWLTAKSQTYAAMLQKYVSTTRTDFTNIDTFLDAFLRELGCLDSDFEEFDLLEDKLDFAKEIVCDVPILLVIDDLDSLDQDKQIELYSRIAQLFDQALSNKHPSRVLFTSRLEPNAGANRLIRIAGFSTEESLDFTTSLIGHLAGTNTWGPEVLSWMNAIQNASKGSPIFIASILRLISFGDDVETVIKNWYERDGEEVRRFAFKREIDSLSYADLRVLYVLQLISSSTFEELMDVLSEDRQALQASLLRVSQFHLFASSGNPATGAQISVPEPIRLMVKITEERLSDSDADELKKRTATAVGRAKDGQSELGQRLRGISLLWTRKRFSEALAEARRATKDFPGRGEASFALGRTYLLQTPPDYDKADEAFKEASQKKFSSRSLLEYWSLTRLKKGDINGLLKITGPFLAPNLSGAALLYRLAGFYRLAITREKQRDYPVALRDYQRLMTEAGNALREQRTEPVTAYVTRLASVVPDYMVDIAYRYYQRESVDRILELAAISTQEGFPPLQTMKKILSDVYAQSNRAATITALRKRTDQCFRIAKALVKALGKEHPLVKEAFSTAHKLQALTR
ncbi:Cdc6-related protein, AAA superfamily ATPase [Bradyrhizobium shewense]|uniref:Cdc6-related protein, AAA superfamily ATPase n=1 Tax=Bradyrhizobium shewense TaxID=1761772 RepID=A0A1C3XHQ9_9BRAD|nr:ATP-binding protein [Bradyrhizobium shewense]SCB51695.1 Cdc6-related protein, AAA superfamily ATPase [Bradyrhizobium shewense]